jgi:hypothetical protein
MDTSGFLLGPSYCSGIGEEPLHSLACDEVYTATSMQRDQLAILVDGPHPHSNTRVRTEMAELLWGYVIDLLYA